MLFNDTLIILALVWSLGGLFCIVKYDLAVERPFKILLIGGPVLWLYLIMRILLKVCKD